MASRRAAHSKRQGRPEAGVAPTKGKVQQLQLPGGLERNALPEQAMHTYRVLFARHLD